MDVAAVFDQLALMIREIPQSGLLMAAVAAMVGGVLGSILLPRVPVLGRFLRFASTFSLMAILVLLVGIFFAARALFAPAAEMPSLVEEQAREEARAAAQQQAAQQQAVAAPPLARDEFAQTVCQRPQMHRHKYTGVHVYV